MKLILFITLLALSKARHVEPECDVVSIHNINYEKEILKDNINSPYQMALDYDTSTLFFSYSVSSEESTDDVFRSAYLDLKTNEYKKITDIPGGFAATVDRNNHKIFLGGRDGIYNFDLTTRKANRIDQAGHSIWQLFFKNKLYYTNYPEENVYSFKDGVSTLVPELKNTKALIVAVDNNDTLYFKNSSGLFYIKKAGDIVLLGDYNVNGVTSDSNNNLYFSTPEGFYNIDANKNVNKLATVDNVYGLVIEGNNNFIYASEKSIIRLKPTKSTCVVNEKENEAFPETDESH